MQILGKCRCSSGILMLESREVGLEELSGKLRPHRCNNISIYPHEFTVSIAFQDIWIEIYSLKIMFNIYFSSQKKEPLPIPEYVSFFSAFSMAFSSMSHSLGHSVG